MFYKLYPVGRAVRTIFHIRVHPRKEMQLIHKWEEHLARVIEEMDDLWRARHLPSNHLPHVFPPNVTCCIDTFPIEINRPGNGQQKNYYNGKYAKHVMKVSYRSGAISLCELSSRRDIDHYRVRCVCLQVQGVCDHRGNIIWYSGPHLGVTSDIRLFRENTPPLDAGEKVLGDKAYIGDARLIAPIKKRRGAATIPRRAQAFNIAHGWYRSTIEHCFAYIKR